MRLFRFFFVFFFFCSLAHAHAEKPKVLVSIAPQKYLVDQIAQGKIDVIVLVPPGASPHSYEPSLRQMMDACKAKQWFRIGESFEVRAKAVLAAYMDVFDLREGIPLLTLHCCSHDLDAHDSHIWLSPKLLKVQAHTIKNALVKLIPEEITFFENNLKQLEEKLDLLDLDIQKKLEPVACRTILVSHPAFGYFCKDYGLKQLSIEMEGKDPTPKQITDLLQEARKEKISTVFVQPQYSKKGAHRIAEELNASLQEVDPYQEDVIANLCTISHLLNRNG